jgi:hypothetical protein
MDSPMGQYVPTPITKTLLGFSTELEEFRLSPMHGEFWVASETFLVGSETYLVHQNQRQKSVRQIWRGKVHF